MHSKRHNTREDLGRGEAAVKAYFCKKIWAQSVITGKCPWTIKGRRLYLFKPKAGFYVSDFEQCDHGKEEGQKEQLVTIVRGDFLFCRFFQQSDGQRDLSVYHLVKDGAGSFK